MAYRLLGEGGQTGLKRKYAYFNASRTGLLLLIKSQHSDTKSLESVGDIFNDHERERVLNPPVRINVTKSHEPSVKLY